MDDAVGRLFARYESFFNRALAGEAEVAEMATLYAAEFIAATPAGVSTGANDDRFHQAMTQGYAYYRSIGTKEMRLPHIRLLPIDAGHCVAHVGWTAIYARPDLPDTEIDFEVHYFVRLLDEEPQVFGWVAGDEQALLKERGII